MARDDLSAPAVERARGRDALALSRLLAARLCHDLAGQAGTALNALLLADEEPEQAGEALGLARDATAELIGRLRYLQAAWGGAGTPADADELRRLADGLPGRRLVLSVDGFDAATRLRAGAARLVLNVLLLASEALPEGGLITLSGNPAGEALVTIEGVRAAWPAGLALCLVDEAAAWDAIDALDDADILRGLQGPLTALIARQVGAKLSLMIAATTRAPAPLFLDLTGV